MEVNKHFNRFETNLEHIYMNNALPRDIGECEYEGFIKCKLIHGEGWSFIYPDMIFLGERLGKWIQPLFFLPNVLEKTEDNVFATIFVDISCHQTLKIQFSSSDFELRGDDGSEYYQCKITGPKDVEEYSTGSYIVRGEFKNGPLVTLFHHTSNDAKDSIIRTQECWLSRWNIQGNKQLKNIGFVYMTCLPEIAKQQDLFMIGMASNGKLQFVRDGAYIPDLLFSNWKELYSNDILDLEVYRENTAGRKNTIELIVDPSRLTPQPIIKHTPPGEQIYFEIVNPFTHRIGFVPNATWKLDLASHNHEYNEVKFLDYIVVGDGLTIDGLMAPFDEENTTFIGKVQRIENAKNILEFWFHNSNSDLYSCIDTELAEFERNL